MVIHLKDADVAPGTVVAPIRLVCIAGAAVPWLADETPFGLGLVVVDQHRFVDRPDVDVRPALGRVFYFLEQVNLVV